MACSIPLRVLVASLSLAQLLGVCQCRFLSARSLTSQQAGRRKSSSLYRDGVLENTGWFPDDNIVRPATNNNDNAGPPPLLLNASVLRRGIEEVAIAQAANTESYDSALSANVTRENMEAMTAQSGAEEAFLKVKPLLPQARAQALQVKSYESVAWQHAKHAQQVLMSFQNIPRDAAQKAREATAEWIAIDAAKTAEKMAVHPGAALAAQDRLADAVAAAAEPYHLALLRNQKFCAETYAKAQSASSSAKKLVGDGKNLALRAQQLQASGMGVDAQESFGIASGMMVQADSLRKWSEKLYLQANKACGTSAGYALMENQAAFNAAATTVINAPMKLPPL